MAELLARMDRPAASWRLEIVAIGDGEPVILRSATLEREEIRLAYGPLHDGADRVEVHLTVLHTDARRLQFRYDIDTFVQAEPASLVFRENGLSSLQGGGDILLARCHMPEQAAALARLLGTDAPVHELRVRLSPA